jgi:uncharacterized protein (TIGR02145 family)
LSFIIIVALGLLLYKAIETPAYENGIMTDYRDGKKYKTLEIGRQTWMAENLNYSDAGDSGKCYNDDPSNCEIYGRLYDWETAMKICPEGWHLPSSDEWGTLYKHVGGNNSFRTTEKKLKSKSGWKDDKNDEYSGNGTDYFGFSALPGGLDWCSPRFDDTDELIGCIEKSNFSFLGSAGFWWTATEDDISPSIEARFEYIPEAVLDEMYKLSLLSVRCVRHRF